MPLDGTLPVWISPIDGRRATDVTIPEFYDEGVRPVIETLSVIGALVLLIAIRLPALSYTSDSKLRSVPLLGDIWRILKSIQWTYWYWLTHWWTLLLTAIA
jgi:hypothetical protein